MLNRIQSAWQGRLPLWVTYWILGVAGNMTFVALLVAVFLVDGINAWLILWLIYALSLIWFVFIFVAIWRAAGDYPGLRLWAVLARAGVLIGVVRMGFEAIVLGLMPTIRI